MRLRADDPEQADDNDDGFYMLQPFLRQGESDSVVYLAGMKKGNLAIVKVHHNRRQLEKESDCWLAWNNVESTYVTTRNCRPALVMPVTFAYDASVHTFVGPNRLAPDKRLGPHDQKPDGHDEMMAQMPTPEEVKAILIKQAVNMAWHGIAHGNLKDEHMAMLPVPPQSSPTGKWTIRPIFIDFGHVQDPQPCGEIMEAIHEWATTGVRAHVVATFPVPQHTVRRPFGLPHLVEPHEGWPAWFKEHPEWLEKMLLAQKGG